MANTATPTSEIKKLHLEAVVLFASNNVPEVDPVTLERFLELVNAEGTFGTITHEQILKKMCLVLKYIPDACAHSLLVLIDLLEIKPANHLALNAPQARWLESSTGREESIPFFVKVQPVSQSLGQ